MKKFQIKLSKNKSFQVDSGVSVLVAGGGTGGRGIGPPSDGGQGQRKTLPGNQIFVCRVANTEKFVAFWLQAVAKVNGKPFQVTKSTGLPTRKSFYLYHLVLVGG